MIALEEIGRELWHALGGNGSAEEAERAVEHWATAMRSLTVYQPTREPIVEELEHGVSLLSGISIAGVCKCHMLPARLHVEIAYTGKLPIGVTVDTLTLSSRMIYPLSYAEVVARKLEGINPHIFVYVHGSCHCGDQLGDPILVRDSARRGVFCENDEIRAPVWRAVLYRNDF